MSITLLRPYCTRDDVQQVTRNEESELHDVMDNAINLASRWIENLCKRGFWFYDHSTTPLTVSRRDVILNGIFLPWPIITLTQLATYDADDSNEDVWDADEYWWENSDNMGLIRSAGGSSQYRKHYADGGSFVPYPNNLGVKVKLTGTFGWGTSEWTATPDDLPAPVRRACMLIAGAFSEEMHKQEVGIDGGISELLDSRVPAEARQMLMPFILRHRSTF